jgi:hypothetical protein
MFVIVESCLIFVSTRISINFTVNEIKYYMCTTFCFILFKVFNLMFVRCLFLCISSLLCLTLPLAAGVGLIPQCLSTHLKLKHKLASQHKLASRVNE